MLHCASCEAQIADVDRFCPACGTPNSAGRLHPRFGPPEREFPKILTRGGDGCGCPRCDTPVVGHDPYCRWCGMALDNYHEEASRSASFGVWTTPGPENEHPYRPLDTLTVGLRALLALDAIVALAITGVALVGITEYTRTFSSLRIGSAELSRWSGWLQTTMAVLLVVTALVFFRWLGRAYRNLPALGVRGLRVSAGWAVAGWFIPMVNLVLPKEAIDDLWRASDPDTRPWSTAWRLRTVPFRVHLWWVVTLSAAIALLATQWVLPGPDALAATTGRTGLLLVIVAHPLLAFSSALLALVVRDVADRQARRVMVLGPPRRPTARRRSTAAPTEIADEPMIGAASAPGLLHADAMGVWGKY